VPSGLGKILVIRGGAIGDFILTIPVLTALRRDFPNVRLELLAYPRLAELALAAGLVHDAASIDARPLASFFARRGPLPAGLVEYFGSFSIIISYLFDPDRIFQDNVARCSKAQFIAGPHRPDERDDVHATDAFLQPLVRLAIFDPDPVPQLQLPPTGSQDHEVRLSPGVQAAADPSATVPASSFWLAAHPGSGSDRKNWPEDRWSELLRRLSDGSDLRVLLVGGEAE
jgi:heptosyltransferase-2